MIFSIDQKVAIPCYTEKAFEHLKSINEDAIDVFASWEEWHKSMEELEIQLQKHGIHIKEVYIDIDELIDYCRFNNVKNTARIRAQFALLKSN